MMNVGDKVLYPTVMRGRVKGIVTTIDDWGVEFRVTSRNHQDYRTGEIVRTYHNILIPRD